MVYLGSKNKISKYITGILQNAIDENTQGFIDICCGGCNIIDKIDHSNKIAVDIHPQLISLLKKVQNNINDIPDYVPEEEYNLVKNNKENYEDWYVGLVGFCASFGSKYFGGYARDKQEKRNIPNERIRNLKDQSKYLNNIKFYNCDFRNIPIIT